MRRKKKNCAKRIKLIKIDLGGDGIFTVYGKRVRRNATIQVFDMVNLQVTKKYKFNLWRKMLRRVGLKFKMFDAIKTEDHG